MSRPGDQFDETERAYALLSQGQIRSVMRGLGGAL